MFPECFFQFLIESCQIHNINGDSETVESYRSRYNVVVVWTKHLSMCILESLEIEERSRSHQKKNRGSETKNGRMGSIYQHRM